MMIAIAVSDFCSGLTSSEFDLEGHGFTQLKCRDWNANKNHLLEWKITWWTISGTHQNLPVQKSQKNK